MTEADLLYHLILVREQLDATIAQLVGLTLAMFVGIYYFLYKAGIWLKIAVFVMYVIGWYVFVGSGALAAQQQIGILMQLSELAKAGEAGTVALQILDTMSSSDNKAYVVMVNIANFFMLFGVFGFLFFWKHPDAIETNMEALKTGSIEEGEEG